MRVAVCYPPDFSVPCMPFGALPLFNACLRRAGHEVKVVDLAALSFDRLTRREHVEDLLSQLDAALAGGDSTLPGERARRLELSRLRAVPPAAALGAEAALERLRQPREYFRPERLRRDMQSLWAALQMINALRPWLDPRNERFPAQLYGALSATETDPWTETYDERLLGDLRAFGPDLVAITMPFAPQLFGSMRFARWVHERLPGTRVVVGGTGIADAEHVLLADPRFFDSFDFVAVGEGETTLPELASRLEAGADLAGVPSLFFRDGGRVVPPEARPYADMNESPTPDYTGIDFSLYATPEKIASLTTSRGCYYGKCTFCPESFRLRFRRRGSSRAWEDVRHIAEVQGIRNFMFWDPLTPPAMLQEISEGSAREGVEIHWMAQVKFDKVYTDPEYVSTLAAGGCRWLQFGFESGVQRVLDDMDKGNDLRRIEVILDRLNEARISVGVFWFIGFPTENEEDARETWRYVVRRRDRIHFTGYIGTFGMGHDVPVFNDPERYDIELFTTPNGDPAYRRRDGGDWDFYHLHETYFAHNDLPWIEGGAALLYSKNRRELVPALTARNALAPPSFVRPIDVADLRVPEGNGYHAWKEAGAAFAYVGHAARLHLLHEGDEPVLDAVRAGASLAEVAARTGQGEDEVLSRLRRFVDFGILATPPMTLDEPIAGEGRVATAG